MRPAVITFYSYKGGVGRTLLAANMGVALARHGKTLIWDLDVEAPGLHRVNALRSEGKVGDGFFNWLIQWQQNKRRPLGKTDLAAFGKLARRTPFKDLLILPAHGDDADPADLYFRIDWRYLLAQDPAIGRDVFNELFEHLGEMDFRHVLLDSRTGLTDLGALISGLLPDATVLVGGYGAQNLGGIAHVRKALLADSDQRRSLRAGRPAPRVFPVASPIPQIDPALLAAGRELWAKTFEIDLKAVAEIRFDPDLPFSEALLINQPAREIAQDYEALASDLVGFVETLYGEHEQEQQGRSERADVFDRLTLRDGSDATVHRGKRFEEKVADLLRLLGYKVEPEQRSSVDQVDLIAHIESGVDTLTYMVECKDESKAVGKDVVDKLAIWLKRSRAKGMHARGMVVANSFSPTAYATAKEEDIRTLTPADLERQLIDFGPHLARLVADFEQLPLATAYVTQRAQLGGKRRPRAGAKAARAGKEDKTERADPEAFKQEALRTLADIEASAPITPDLVAHGLQWAQGRGSRLWVLLGDYGTGKTAFTEKLAYELAKIAAKDGDAPVPLRVNLRDFANKVSLEELLADHWLQATGQRKDPRVLLHLIERGRIVLLLDSFDEMGIAAAGRSVVEQFRMLVRLTGAAGDRPQSNRVLITCREQFFREHGEALDAAMGNGDRISLSPLQDVAQRFDGEIDTVLTFNKEQITAFLNRRLGEAEGRAAMKFLRQQNLLELGDRPQLLDIIIQSLPALKEREASGASALTIGALYQTYTNKWLDEFKPVERQSTSEMLRTVLEVLAQELWKRAGNRIHYGDLYTLIRKREDLRGKLDPNQLDVELRTAAFLSRTPDGMYGFSHRSFLEYFLARRIERAASKADELAQVLDIPRLSIEVCSLADDLMPFDAESRVALGKSLKRLLASGEPDSSTSGVASALTARVNALILGHRLALSELEPADLKTDDAGPFAKWREAMARYIPRGASLAGADLSESTLRVLCAPGIDLSGARLDDADLSHLQAPGANLALASLVRAALENADLSDADLRRANFTDCRATGLRLDQAHAQDSVWLNADLSSCSLTRTDMSRADLRCARLTRVQGKPDLTDALLHGATALGAKTFAVKGRSLVQPALQHLQIAPAALHFGEVSSVAFSADGKTLASAGADRTVRLWDAASGKLLRVLEGHQGSVNSLAYSADGETLASAGDDGTVRLWDAASGKLLRALDGHQDWIRSLAFSADGKTLASAGHDKTVRLWDAMSGKLLRALEGHQGSVSSLAFSADGKTLASAGFDETVRLWDAMSGKLLRGLEGHQGSVNSVAFSADGKTLASAGADRTVRLWDAASGKLLRVLEGHQGSVNSLAHSADGKTLAGAGDDGTVRLWDAASGKLLRGLEGHQGSVNSMAFSADGKTLASAGDDSTVRLWDVASGKLLRALEGHQGSVTSMAYSADGKILASAGNDGTVRLWDAASAKLLRALEGQQGSVMSLAYSANGKTLASAGDDGTVCLWDAMSGKLLRALEGHQGWVMSVAYGADGKALASAGDDGTVCLWDAANGKLLRALEGHQGSVTSVAYSVDGKILASAGSDSTVRLWNAMSGKLMRGLEGHQGSVNSVAFSADGKILASAGSDSTVCLWDAMRGKLLRALVGHQGSVNSVAFSADGKTLASAGDDGTVRLWDAASGKLLRALEGHQGSVTSVAYSADGKTLASAGDDSTVRLWNLGNIGADNALQTEVQRLVGGNEQRGLINRAMRSGAGQNFPPGNWYSLDCREDARGRWRGQGPILNTLQYRDMAEEPQPWPWLPRDWLATDLPELQAPD